MWLGDGVHTETVLVSPPSVLDAGMLLHTQSVILPELVLPLSLFLSFPPSPLFSFALSLSLCAVVAQKAVKSHFENLDASEKTTLALQYDAKIKGSYSSGQVQAP